MGLAGVVGDYVVFMDDFMDEGVVVETGPPSTGAGWPAARTQESLSVEGVVARASLAARPTIGPVRRLGSCGRGHPARPVRRALLAMASRGSADSFGSADANIVRVKPRRQPGLWVIAVVFAVLIALLGYSVATDGSYAWPTYRRHILDREFGRAALVTLELTGVATVIAVGLGAALAGMRASGNIVLRAISWAYLWLLRSTPVYLQLVLWGLFTQVYGHVGLGVPGGARISSLDLTKVVTTFVAACIGLGLNAAAYQAEVFRTGFASVPSGQREAAVLLGMSPALVRRRVVWPQASRVVIPATLERIATTVKVSALVVAVPFAGDLYGRSVKTAALAQRAVPLVLAAATWYLLIVSCLLGLRWLTARAMDRAPKRPDVAAV
jgi:polar amino acid transport system permease protein